MIHTMKYNILLRFLSAAFLFAVSLGNPKTVSAQCAGMPNAGVPFGGPLSHTCSGNSNLDLGGATTGVGMIYQWEWSTDGTNWFPNGGPQTMTTVSTGFITQTTMFRVISTCTASGMSNVSPAITVTIIPGTQVTPAATITPSTGTTACVDDEITFTSTITNGGSTPVYQWDVNGTPVGTNSNTYVAPAGFLSTNDNVTLTVTSSNPCAVPQTALASVTMTVLPLTTPTVSIQATEMVICQGEPVTFTATDNAPGGTYQWYVNGNPAGTNQSFYTYYPYMGDVITLDFTPPAAGCYDNITVASNSIPMDVTAGLPTLATVSAVPNAVEGTWVTVYANLFNFSLNYTIDWFINNNYYTTTTVPYMSFTKGPGTDDIFAVANNSGTGCYLTDTSNQITIEGIPTSVNGVNAPADIHVYPNPATGAVKVLGLAEGDKLELVNVLGQTVLRKEVTAVAAEELLDLGSLPSGNYILNVRSRDGSFKQIVRLSKN